MADSNQAPMFYAFIQVKGLEGESFDKQHKDWSEVLSFSWGIEQQAGYHESAEGAKKEARHAHFRDFTITKLVDVSSTGLYARCAGGMPCDNVRFEVSTRVHDVCICYLYIAMKEAIVSSIELLDRIESVQGAPRPVERVSFRYGEIYWSYSPVSQDGEIAGPTHKGGWSLKKDTHASWH